MVTILDTFFLVVVCIPPLQEETLTTSLAWFLSFSLFSDSHPQTLVFHANVPTSHISALDISMEDGPFYSMGVHGFLNE